ncbi:omega-amino acid-pyruvate aminotransferase [Clathrospora elynae]|uniref:Omega-amino acid-pyruvate aminotransferase n=1 Tax=Clathrospora elynae TaxID=706981 RepID=A0A6A5SKE6_9PLEO|nr:omega-amino acid-pyruvate aminotransferase [Clathrospora elynae]
MAPGTLLNESNSPISTDYTSILAPTNTDTPTTAPHRPIPLPLWSPPFTSNTISPESVLLRRNARSPPLWNTYADGNWLEVSDGTRKWKIFDGSGGAGVSNIGHNDRRVYAAIDEQRETGVSYAASLSFRTAVVENFANFLIHSTNYEMAEAVFYCSGSEATDAAQKLCYQYHSRLKQDPQPGCRWFIARERSYHGATLGALELSGHRGRKEMYKPILPENTQFVSSCYPYRDMKEGETAAQYVERLADELDRKIRKIGPEKVAGFIAEPVVGAALGCVPALPGYLAAMKKVCRKHGVLIIFDEIMCGMGRTGRMHAWQEEGVVPDILLVGKGLAGGYAAISAMIVGKEIVVALGHGVFAHGHTFQNFPAACAAGLAVQMIIQDENLIQNAYEKGEKLEKKLAARLGNHPHVGNIRGPGLFKGIEFVLDKKTKETFHPEIGVAWQIYERGLTPEYGIYVYPGSGTVDGFKGDHIIIAPAYNVTDEDIDLVVDRVSNLITSYFEDLKVSSK